MLFWQRNAGAGKFFTQTRLEEKTQKCLAFRPRTARGVAGVTVSEPNPKLNLVNPMFTLRATPSFSSASPLAALLLQSSPIR